MGHYTKRRRGLVWHEPENLTDDAQPIEQIISGEMELTPEQEKQIRDRFRRSVYEWGKWVSKIVMPKTVGARLHGWRLTNDPDREGRAIMVAREGPKTGLRVFLSGATYDDGRRWIHLSVSKFEGIPSWDELKRVKDRFLGADSLALQVFPPKDEWVNLHANILHLWVCVDERPTPDFREDIAGVIKSI